MYMMPDLGLKSRGKLRWTQSPCAMGDLTLETLGYLANRQARTVMSVMQLI